MALLSSIKARVRFADPINAGRLEACRAAAEREPHNPDLWLARADLAQATGAVGESIDCLFRVADLYALSGLRDRALEPVRRILELDPTHAGARRLLRIVGSVADEVEGTRPGEEPPPVMASGSGAHEIIPAGSALESLRAIGTLVERKAGATIITEGELGGSVSVVVAGSLVVTVDDATHGTTRRLAEVGPGAFIGELSFLLGGRRTATVTALTEVTLLEITADALRQRLASDRPLREQITRSARTRLLTLIAASLASTPPFSSLSVPARRAVIHKLRMRRLHPDEVLVHRGQQAEGLYFVAVGRLEAFLPGSPPRVFRKLRPGDVLDGGRLASATVHALEPSCVFVLAHADRALITER